MVGIISQEGTSNSDNTGAFSVLWEILWFHGGVLKVKGGMNIKVVSSEHGHLPSLCTELCFAHWDSA